MLPVSFVRNLSKHRVVNLFDWGFREPTDWKFLPRTLTVWSGSPLWGEPPNNVSPCLRHLICLLGTSRGICKADFVRECFFGPIFTSARISSQNENWMYAVASRFFTSQIPKKCSKKTKKWSYYPGSIIIKGPFFILSALLKKITLKKVKKARGTKRKSLLNLHDSQNFIIIFIFNKLTEK